MTILEEAKHHFENKNCVKFKRVAGELVIETSTGYILDYSSDFVLIQEVYDFILLGFNIFPTKSIQKIRYNRIDKYHSNIMRWEGKSNNIILKHKIDLTNWSTLFRSIKNLKLNVIVECEYPEIDTFTIGPITKITKKFVHIHHFDATGYLDEEPISIDFTDISSVKFDDPYINVYSKYLRVRKPRKKI